MCLNASDERGTDSVKTRVAAFAKSRPLFAKGPKFVIMDEADCMTESGQDSLKRVIEWQNDVSLILICNFVSRISNKLRGMCIQLRFPRLSSGDLRSILRRTTQGLGLDVDEELISRAVAIGDGDARKAISTLQDCNSTSCEAIDRSILGHGNQTIIELLEWARRVSATEYDAARLASNVVCYHRLPADLTAEVCRVVNNSDPTSSIVLKQVGRVMERWEESSDCRIAL